MQKHEVLQSLQQIGLVPVLRADSVDKALAIAGAIADGGVTVLEITMTVPGAIEVMRKLAEQRPDILIGAGTVLTGSARLNQEALEKAESLVRQQTAEEKMRIR